YLFFFSSRRRHTRCYRDWSSDVCSSDLVGGGCVGLRRVAEFTGVGLAGPGADEHDLGAGLAEPVDGVPDFELLVLLLDEDGDAEIGRASWRERGWSRELRGVGQKRTACR